MEDVQTAQTVQQELDAAVADVTQIVTALYTKDAKTGKSPMEDKFSEPAKNYKELFDEYLSSPDVNMLPDRFAKLEEEGLNPKQAVDDFMKLNGLSDENTAIMGAGSNALAMRLPATKDSPFGVCMRITADPREPDRLADPSVLQAVKSFKQDGVKVELVPVVPTVDDVYSMGEKMGMSKADLEVKMSKLFVGYASNLSKGTIDTDPQEGNICFLLDQKGKLIIQNIDPGAVVKEESLKPKKLATLQDIYKDNYTLPEGIKNPLQKNDDFAKDFDEHGLQSGLKAVNKDFYQNLENRLNRLKNPNSANTEPETKRQTSGQTKAAAGVER